MYCLFKLTYVGFSFGFPQLLISGGKNMGGLWQRILLLKGDNGNMDELVLVNRVRENCDDAAFNEVLNGHIKMIESIVLNCVNEIGDFRLNKDDLKQEAIIGLYDACKCYKEDMNTKFSTFAYTCIKRRVHAYYRKCTHLYCVECVSLDNSVVKDSGLIYGIQKEQESIKDKMEVLNKLMTQLNYEDRMIVDMRIKNYSYKEISDYLNIKEKRIDNRLMRIKNRLSKSDLVNKNKLLS